MGRVTPGLAAQALTRDEVNFNIRGQSLGPSQVGVRSAPGVVSYFAEVPIPIAPGSFYDLQNVQVLKGPQGTLFGRNTTGGAVLVEPRSAEDDNNGYAQIGFGNYDLKQFQGVVNVAPVPGTVALRLAGSVSRRDGFTQSIITGQKLDSRNYETFRATLRLTPGDRLENETIVSYYGADNTGSSEIIRAIDGSAAIGGTVGDNPSLAALAGLGAFAGLTPAQVLSIPLSVGGGASIGCLGGASIMGCPAPLPLPPGFEQFGGVAAAFLAAYVSSVGNGGGLALIAPNSAIADVLATKAMIGPRRTQVPMELRSTRHDWSVINRTQYEVSDSIVLKNIFSFSKARKNVSLDFDGTPFDFLDTLYRVDAPWSGGNNLLTEEFQIQGDLDSVNLNYILGIYHEHSWPGFQQASTGQILGTPSTRLPTGRDESNAVFAHVEWNPSDIFGISAGIRQSWDKRRSSITVLDANGNCTLSACPVSFSAKYNALTYDVTATVRPAEELLFYASYRKGYKAGGINLPPPTIGQALFNPETVKSLELGVKADADIGIPVRFDAAAFLDDYLNRQQGITASSGSGLVVVNAPKSKIRGFEATATILPVQGLVLSGFVSHLRAYATTTLPGFFSEGRQFQNQCKWQWGVNGAWTVPLRGDNGAVTLSADWSWQDEAFNTNVPSLIPTYPSYGTGNARIQWSDVMGNPFDLAVFVTNFTDKTVAVGGYPIADFGFDSAFYNEPRMYGMTLKIRFGS